ncbi:MAG: energy transducer TonB [Terriglobales bacterium]
MLKWLIALVFLVFSCLAGPLVGAQSAAKPKVIGTAVSGGKMVKSVWPVYPPEVTAKAIAEGVVVKLTIDKQGVPRDLRVTKGDSILAKVVLEALRQWRWKPYKLNGEPVEVESSIYIRFDPLTDGLDDTPRRTLTDSGQNIPRTFLGLSRT